MAELKTQRNKTSVSAFLNSIEDEQKRKDAKALLKVCKKTQHEGRNVVDSIVGFGSYYYKSERSTQERELMLTAFLSRKAQTSIYIMTGFGDYAILLGKLGKHKVSKESLYIKKLADIYISRCLLSLSNVLS
jgi:hypothetical protein